MRKVSLWLTIGFIIYLLGISIWLITRGANEIEVRFKEGKIKPYVQVNQSIVIFSKAGTDTLKLSDSMISTVRVSDMVRVVVLVDNWQGNMFTAKAEDISKISIICTESLTRLNLEVYDMATIEVRCNVDTLHVSGDGMGKIKLSGEYEYVEGNLRGGAKLIRDGELIIKTNKLKLKDGAKVII
ncbi:MAG: hypothetical protein GXO48_09100 [Chlorobi bacterium]|nr:hypothetical protein [Chlorobiota bacterium]